MLSAKNMALGESKSDKGPTRSSFERLPFKISQGSREVILSKCKITVALFAAALVEHHGARKL